MTINLFMYKNLFVKTHMWRVGVWLFLKAYAVGGRGFKTHRLQNISIFFFYITLFINLFFFYYY